MFQTLLDLDPRASILSMDGVGSNNATMAGFSKRQVAAVHETLLQQVNLLVGGRCRDCSQDLRVRGEQGTR